MASTRVAVLTGVGLGAVGVVRVWGDGAIDVADGCFRSTRNVKLSRTFPLRPSFGRLGRGIGDEVVAMVFPGPTPEVEIQCHGGPAAIRSVLDVLIEAGAERVESSRWIRDRAGSRLQAEAAIDLPKASTLRSAAHLLDQVQGALDRSLRSIADGLDRNPLESLAEIDMLLDRAEFGTRLISGYRVVLAGRPNVGKSRLLNALVGFDRAIVDPAPGTTRDVVSARTAIDGLSVEIADTAGLRSTDDPIEAAGVARARTDQRRADLVLLVFDQSEPLTDADHRLVFEYPKALIVANKLDLPQAWAWDGSVVSAEKGIGIEALLGAIGHRLVPNPPPPGADLPFRPRHARRLKAIRRAVETGRNTWAQRTLHRWLLPFRPRS